MFSYLFTFRSQTAAQSGRRILYEAGLWTQLRRAPQEVSSLGCTWGVTENENIHQLCHS